MIFKYFLPLLILFTLLMMTFDVQKSLILMKTNLSFFVFLFLLLLKSFLSIHCQIQGREILPLFSSKSFVILDIIFRLLIHFELTFAYDVR